MAAKALSLKEKLIKLCVFAALREILNIEKNSKILKFLYNKIEIEKEYS